MANQGFNFDSDDDDQSLQNQNNMIMGGNTQIQIQGPASNNNNRNSFQDPNQSNNQQNINPNQFDQTNQSYGQNQNDTQAAMQPAENMRIGGNYTFVKDPSCPPYSRFYLIVNGHIQSGTMNDRDGICCKYDFKMSQDWHCTKGNKSGVSQHAYKSQQTNRKVVWNFPFECVFRSFNISGWPNLVLTFTSRDFWGRDVICGYGVTNVPTQPGSHTRYVQVFTPVSSSMLSDFLGFLAGKPAEYIKPAELLHENEGREVTRVQPTGTVRVQFNVTMKDMQKFGIYPYKN